MAHRILPDLPMPPELPEPEPPVTRRAWGKIPYEDRFRRQREDLLTAAATLVADHGVPGTSVAAITARAGVSKRVFYEHFADKDACFAELIRQISAGNLRQAVAAADAATGRTPFETLRAVIRALVGGGSDDPRMPAVAAARADLTAESVLNEQWVEHRRRVAQLLVAVALRLGSQLPEDTLRLAALILVNGVVDLRAELAGRRGAVSELATICCLAFGLSPAR